MSVTSNQRPPSLTKATSPEGEEIWTTDRGEARAILKAPGVVLITVIGYSKRETFPLLVGRVEEQIAAGRQVSWFGDYENMTGYDLDLRSSLAHFTKYNRKHFARVGILVRSKMVSLAVTVANLMVGGFIVAYTSRHEFDRAIEDRVRQSRNGLKDPPRS